MNVDRQRPSWPTEEEQRMIKEFIVLPFVLSVFERDAKVIGHHVKTNAPYIQNIELAMGRISTNLTELRKEFRTRGIHMFPTRRTDHGIHCNYMCRGYEKELEFMWNDVRAEVEIRMKHYLGTHMELYRQQFGK